MYVVLKVFAEYLKGRSLLNISKELQAEDIPYHPCEENKWNKNMIKRILENEAFRKAEIVMIYRAVRGEVRLDLLPVRAPEKKYVYPLCMENSEMRALLPGSAESWRSGPFHIPEPDPDLSEEISPDRIDLVLCPCTAFDAECSRLGMGGGYYDRFLPQCRNAAIFSVAFEVQRAESVPHDLLDRQMDGVITEEGTYGIF